VKENTEKGNDTPPKVPFRSMLSGSESREERREEGREAQNESSFSSLFRHCEQLMLDILRSRLEKKYLNTFSLLFSFHSNTQPTVQHNKMSHGTRLLLVTCLLVLIVAPCVLGKGKKGKNSSGGITGGVSGLTATSGACATYVGRCRLDHSPIDGSLTTTKGHSTFQSAKLPWNKAVDTAALSPSSIGSVHTEAGVLAN